MAIDQADIPGQEPADKILHSALGLEANRTAFLKADRSRSERERTIVQQTRIEISQLNTVQSKKLVTLVFDSLAKEDSSDGDDQDKRDAALELIDLIDLDHLSSQFLLTSYKQSVQKLKKDADPLGSIDSMITVGKKIAPFLPPGQGSTQQIMDIWEIYMAEIPSNEDRRLIQSGIPGIYNLIPKPEDETDDLGWRDAPVLEKNEKELHDEYLKMVRERATFKLTLWESTADFRRVCEESGVRLERFWNLSDPDQVAAAIISMQNARSPIYEQFVNPSLVARTGLTLDAITPENARIIADEVVAAVVEGRDNILKSVGDPDRARASSRNDADQAIIRFRGLIDQGGNIRNPRAQRSLLQQISGFLTENGVEVPDLTIDGLQQLLNDEVSLATVRKSFQSKVTERQAAAQILGDAFGGLKPPSDFALISRTEEDLFLGDLTGDCTAYHLNVGMNAWTVPIWLTNPGFTIFKIGEGDGLTAKMGLLLGVSDKGPVIIIDSIEAGKNITDEEVAKEKIKEGLHFLNQWARRTGISQVLISNVSNSSDLVSELQGVSEPSELKKLQALGDLSGIAEVRRNLLGNATKERIYIQTEQQVDENDEEYMARQAITAPVAAQIERLIYDVLMKAKKGERESILSLARAYKGEELMSLLISINFPEWTSLMGSQISNYRDLMDLYVCDESANVRLTQTGSKDSPEQALYDYLFDKFGINDVDFELVSEEDNGLSLDKKTKEVYNKIDKATEDPDLEEMLETLKVVEHFNISVNDILRKLYKATEIDESGDLLLNPKTPLLVA